MSNGSVNQMVLNPNRSQARPITSPPTKTFLTIICLLKLWRSLCVLFVKESNKDVSILNSTKVVTGLQFFCWFVVLFLDVGSFEAPRH